MPNFKKNLTAEKFAEIGSLAFHERWQSILAAEMRDTVVSDRAMESDGSGDSDPHH